MPREHIVQNISARLGSDAGGGLSVYYADQVELTGIHTTAADVFEAWMRWLREQGGMPAKPLAPGVYHARVATALREVARYL
jgi:hypothetical protein